MKIAVHNGAFHADDVFAVATILLFTKEKKAEIFRTRDFKIIDNADYVLDVGGVYDVSKKRFDHHMSSGAGKRQNGIPYAAFGLVWKEFGEKICGSKKVAEMVDDLLVAQTDAIDSGAGDKKPIMADTHIYDLAQIIWMMNPTWREKKYDSDKVFLKLVSWAQKILKREIKIAKDIVKGQKFAEKAYKNAEDKRIIIMDDKYPYEYVLNKYSEPLFVVLPQSDGNWKARVMRNDPRVFAVRASFPESWAGLMNGDLAKVSGVSDAIFCHNKRFLAVAKSKEGAIALAKLALDSLQ